MSSSQYEITEHVDVDGKTYWKVNGETYKTKEGAIARQRQLEQDDEESGGKKIDLPKG